jgi:hypothetical protein
MDELNPREANVSVVELGSEESGRRNSIAEGN